MNKSRITGGQLTALILASRMAHGLLLPTTAVAGLTLVERLVAIVVSGVCLFLLFLPTIGTLRQRSSGLIDLAYRHSRAHGRMVCMGYAALCVFILCVDILQFCDFADQVMPSGFSVGALVVALIVVAFVASFYGMEALARTALPVLVFAGLCLCVFGAALLPEMRMLHFPPTSSGRIVTAVLHDLPRTAEVAVIGMLYPYSRSSRIRIAAWVAGGVTALTTFVTVTSLAVLGDFAAETPYPYYTAVTAVQLGVFERPDILITAVWLGTFFVRMTVFCLLFTTALRRPFGRPRRIAVAGAVGLSLFALAVSRGWVAGAGLDVIYPVVLGVFAVAVPLWLRWCR